jgi:hypothetical protein
MGYASILSLEVSQYRDFIILFIKYFQPRHTDYPAVVTRMGVVISGSSLYRDSMKINVSMGLNEASRERFCYNEKDETLDNYFGTEVIP